MTTPTLRAPLERLINIIERLPHDHEVRCDNNALETARAALAAQPELPERDQSLPTERQGLFHKFDVRRTDGSDAPGGKHHGCRYFVLDVDHDAHAAAALTAYAAACAETHPQLASDLREKWGAKAQPELPEPVAYFEETQSGESFLAYSKNTDAPQIPLYTAAQLQQAVEQAKPVGSESVLVDGTAYDIPSPVAAELLRLNIELKQARASAPRGVPSAATKEMMRAAVIYANGADVYDKVPLAALEIEESIYGEAYAAMVAAAPQPPEKKGPQ